MWSPQGVSPAQDYCCRKESALIKIILYLIPAILYSLSVISLVIYVDSEEPVRPYGRFSEILFWTATLTLCIVTWWTRKGAGLKRRVP